MSTVTIYMDLIKKCWLKNPDYITFLTMFNTEIDTPLSTVGVCQHYAASFWEWHHYSSKWGRCQTYFAYKWGCNSTVFAYFWAMPSFHCACQEKWIQKNVFN